MKLYFITSKTEALFNFLGPTEKKTNLYSPLNKINKINTNVITIPVSINWG